MAVDRDTAPLHAFEGDTSKQICVNCVFKIVVKVEVISFGPCFHSHLSCEISRTSQIGISPYLARGEFFLLLLFLVFSLRPEKRVFTVQHY